MAEVAVLAGLGWVASPVISKLVNDSISYLGSDIARDLEDLETVLLPQFQLTIEAAQHSPHKALFARWLARLKNAYFDAESILHNLEYERLKRKAKGKNKKLLLRLSSRPIIKPIAKLMGQVRLSCKPIIKRLSKFADRAVKKASLLSRQKRKLLKRLNKLKEIAAEAKNLRDLLGIQNTKSILNAGNNTSVTTSLLGNSDKVIGRDGDRDEIINFLLNEQEGSSSIKRYSVVAVTGMGGVGKTTLAQYVYNDPRVQDYFGVRMWLCLSQKFDIKDVTKEMIECTSGKHPDLFNLNNLQEELVRTLSDSKKVMVVLDDIWYDNNDGAIEKKQWENLLKPLDFRGGTCKILVTSRSTSFPIELQPAKLIQLGNLTPGDFKSLIRYHSIDGLQITDPQLKNDMSVTVDLIAQKISKLPLAAKVVGNQLCERPDIMFWRDILENVNLSNIMEILLWSFYRFDVQLQRCFLFCSVFPKSKIYNLDILVPYWVALDFIQPLGDDRNVNDICLEYFQKMIANSILHPVDKPHTRYMIHDLFHDLAENLSAEDCFRVTNVVREIPSTVQHVYLSALNENLKENLSSICNLSNLRTLILGQPYTDDISEIILKISTNCKNLRVLNVSLWGYKTVLPKVMGALKTLRFVSFWASSIMELSDSIVQLYHLQFLELPSFVMTLPTKFSNLIKLRSIVMFNNYGHPVHTLPSISYLGKLTSLQRLEEFHVRKNKGYELHQLGPLKEVGGSLRIINLENVVNKDEAIEARLIDKSKLKKLELVWVQSTEINSLEIDVIEALRPPTNLEMLTIDGYMGLTYPTWMQEGSFINNIKDVKFYNCNAMTILLPNFYQFRHCSELHLQNLGALRALSTFPKDLVKLSIIKCPSLILVCENELQVNENQSSFVQFLTWGVGDSKAVLDHELKSFEQTGSKENFAEQLQIMESTVEVSAVEFQVNVNKAWWCCHQQRMNFISSLPPERARESKLKLPSMLRILDLGYCCVSDGALSDCLRGMVTLEELYLSGIMTITTLPPAQVFESLESIRVVKIIECWYLSSLCGLHALPGLKLFWVEACYCLIMDGLYSPLPPTLQSFTIIRCTIPWAIFNGNLPCLQNVVINGCDVPSSLSFHQLTLLKSLALVNCPDLKIIEGLKSRPFFNTLQLVLLPELVVESVLESWQGCRGQLFISSSVMLNKILSSQDFIPPRELVIKCCHEEAISFEKSDHLQSIKYLEFFNCKTACLPKTLSDFSTIECLHFIGCPRISELPELPCSVRHIVIRDCPVLEERCLPNRPDWHKIPCIDNLEIVGEL